MTLRPASYGQAAAALVAMVLLTSCLPEYVPQTPNISGSIVDAETGAPVAGATLRYPAFPATTVTTDADGVFTFPAIERWEIVIPLGDRNPAVELNVSAPSYGPERLTVYFGDQERQTIRLQHQADDSTEVAGD